MDTASKPSVSVCPLCEAPLPIANNVVITNAKTALPHFEHFRNKPQEYFVCLSLSSGRRLLARRVVTIGLLDATLVHPREVFAGPLTDRAAAVIIAHNHPSGDRLPSRHDIETTQQLIAAAQLLGIRLLDHVILTKKGHYSFAANGLIDNLPFVENVKDYSAGQSTS